MPQAAAAPSVTPMINSDDKALERALIERCKQGDITAFNELVLQFEKRVFNFAYRMSGNYDDACDVSQEAFIRVFNSINTFRGEANFTTWLYRIVTNVYLDERKKQKSHLHTSLEDYIDLEENSVTRQVEDGRPTPGAVVEQAERDAILAKAIQELPEYQRAMVILYHTQNRSYEEIAEILKLPIGTVKSRLNRARLALKEKLEPLKELFNL
jgi:RNA polymerase sigma-70 factor, ECF subfamily